MLWSRLMKVAMAVLVVLVGCGNENTRSGSTGVVAGAAPAAVPARQHKPEPEARSGSVLTWEPLEERFVAAKIRTYDGAGYCAISTAGGVACWGRLGRPMSDLISATPMRLVGLSHITDAAMNDRELCVIGDANRVACYLYETSDHRADDLRSPAIALAATDDIVCGRSANGTVECSRFESELKNLAGVKSLSCRSGTCCAVVGDGHVACWGAENILIGYHPSAGAVVVDVAAPIDEKGPPVQSILLTSQGACARTTDGGAYCWGAESAKQLMRPGSVRALVDPGAGGVCLLGHDGALTCASGNPKLDHVVDASGECAVHVDGHVSCWGLSLDGRLGDGKPLDYLVPTQVPGVSGATSIGMSGAGVCAVSGEKVTCWGDSPRVELASPSGLRVASHVHPWCALSPDAGARCVVDNRGWAVVALDLPRAPAGAKALAANRRQWCAIDATDRLQCAGGDWVKRLIATPTGVSSVAPVSNGFCAVLRDGRVGCVNTGLDDDALPARPAFMLVDGIRGAVEVAGDSSLTCARTRTGDVYCWSRNDYGRTEQPPAPVAAIKGASELAMGGFHACALVSGAVWCWGQSDDGMLGTGTIPARKEGQIFHEPANTPARVKASFVATHIAASEDATCALDEAGQAWCWGSDRYGAIGQGRVMESAAPVRVVRIGPP
jgi:alpha-tubulin suppressor-like RCC1 family protein